MKLILFGATWMVGQGVLREALLDPGVAEVLCVGRSATGKTHEKLKDLVIKDLYDLAPNKADLGGYDACLFCLGVSAAGMKEADYRRVTHDLTLAVAKVLLEANPGMTFIYVSGAGTGGSSMWARVKGETESDLLALGFKRAFMFRPGYIQPQHGVKSRTTLYRVVYIVMWPFNPIMRLFPGMATTTERVGRAMVEVARNGYEKKIVENRDVNLIAKRTPAPGAAPSG
jgi:uncharacterized protein YbjT (DUF2867 family)